MPDSFPNEPGPFESTAYYYARFRKPYPQEIFRSITERFQLDGTGNLLDVGCGTGLLSLPIAEKFEGVTGIDPDPEMIEEARHQAEHLGVENAGFLVASGEDVEPGMGKFRLVLFGSSLHWMDIDDVLARARAVLTSAGGIAICGMPSLWGGESEWERAIVATVQRWLGADRRAGSGPFPQSDRRFEEVISENGFTNISTDSTECEFHLDIPFIIGHLYSTSYCSRKMLGDRADAFEDDLTETLTRLNPAGKFPWRVPAYYLFADPT